MLTEFTKLAEVGDLAPGQMRTVKAGAVRPLARRDEYFALDGSARL